MATQAVNGLVAQQEAVNPVCKATAVGPKQVRRANAESAKKATMPFMVRKSRGATTF